MSRASAWQVSMLIILMLLTICFESIIIPKTITAQQGDRSEGKAARTYRVVHGWPKLPPGYVLGQVSGVGVDSHNQVFVFHRGDHSVERSNQPIEVPTVMCFDGETGKLVMSWGAHMFMVPHALRMDPADNVWLTDVGLHQVFKFNHDGKLLMALGTKGTPGCDAKHFNGPTDIAFAPDGSFYVSDGYGNSRIAKFSPDGSFLFDWGHKGEGPGEFNIPHSIAIDPEGRIYVADRGNSRVQVFEKDGKFLYQWQSAELGRPWGLALGPDGCLYVVDGGDLHPKPPDRGRIVKLDLKGNILAAWASFGNYDGQLYWGHDIAVSGSGDVYVGDVNYGMRVQKFSLTDKECLTVSH